MTDTTSDDATDRADRSAPSSRVPTLCRARIERYDEQPDVCTIYSALDRASVRTTWISAEDGSYLALESAR